MTFNKYLVVFNEFGDPVVNTGRPPSQPRLLKLNPLYFRPACCACGVLEQYFRQLCVTKFMFLL